MIRWSHFQWSKSPRRTETSGFICHTYLLVNNI